MFEAGGVARSGHLYGDRTGVEYEYPKGRYEKWIQSGDRFIYSAPRTGYIGCGIIARIRPSSDPERLICDVSSVRYFAAPVPLTDTDGNYYEADPAFWKDKIYFGQGVRPLSDERFDRIIAASGTAAVDPDPITAQFATPADARLIEEVSVLEAIRLMEDRFRQAVKRMPHNNPGFDLLVGSEEAPTRYVEVKGSQSTTPAFFMSEGERAFSGRNAGRYTLVVVTGINIADRSPGAAVVRDGAVEGDDVELQVAQWRGRLTRWG